MSGRTVHLGFEVGTGAPVSVPLRHMVITGQTQEAGKTTALEALVSRAKVKAVAFVTKRGEGSFEGAYIIPPYFREQADWKFVAAILEASRSEKLKFERSWIIRASKGARTLADVQKNVRKALETAKGIHADVYLTLDAYLDDVVPQIEQVQWAKRVDLHPGLNVMDMTALNVEMQHLVIRSTIEWVLNYETNTIVVVPEAWKFIPQGRGTPVKLAAEAYIRQAAGLGNYLWLDSQDIAGVEKIILKSVPVWVLGVQRESNEIKRTLAQIPENFTKPKPNQVATLGLGQFWACYGNTTVHVYAQPTWVSDKEAERTARERLQPRVAARGVAVDTGNKNTSGAIVDARSIARKEDDQVNKAEAAALRAENDELRSQVAELSAKIEALSGDKLFDDVASTARTRAVARTGDASRAADAFSYAAPAKEHVGNGKPDDGEDALYRRFFARLQGEDPAIIRLATKRPELIVEVERKTITLDTTTVKGRVAKLLAEGFFQESHTQGETRAALKRSGPDINTGSLSKAFAELVVDGFLTAEGGGRYAQVKSMISRIVER